MGIGFAMLGLGLWSVYLRWKGTLFSNRTFLTAAMLMTPSGFGAVLFGWFTAEIGRQPYVVYGHLRTADAVSPVSAQAVGTTLVIFIVVYAFVFGFGSYYLAKLLRRGLSPSPAERYDNVGEIAEILRAHLRPKPWFAMAAGVALTLGVVGTVLAAMRPPIAKNTVMEARYSQAIRLWSFVNSHDLRPCPLFR